MQFSVNKDLGKIFFKCSKSTLFNAPTNLQRYCVPKNACFKEFCCTNTNNHQIWFKKGNRYLLKG